MSNNNIWNERSSKIYTALGEHILKEICYDYFSITALASATVVFIECMSMAFAYVYDHDLKVK